MLSSVASAPELVRGFDLLSDITPATIGQAAFAENLYAFTEDGTEVGYYRCDISTEGGRIIWIKEQSEYTIDGTIYITELLTELNLQLVTVDEIYEETQKKDRQLIRRKLKLHKVLDTLDVELETVNNAVSNVIKKNYSKTEIRRFFGHGANLIFQRMFILTNAEKGINMTSVDRDGNLCDLNYEYLGEKTMQQDNEAVSVFGIHLTLNLQDGSEKSWQKYFTMDGQLLSQIQIGLPVVFKAKSIPDPICHDTFLSRPIIKDDGFYWDENMELFSRFNRRKEQLKSDYHLYFYQHPEFNDMLKDFLQAVLMNKPTDVLNFAADFFTSLSKRQILPPRLKKT